LGKGLKVKGMDRGGNGKERKRKGKGKGEEEEEKKKKKKTMNQSEEIKRREEAPQHYYSIHAKPNILYREGITGRGRYGYMNAHH
jgi:hypothetical protein